MSLKNENRSIIDLLKLNDTNELVLPDFQRDFEWVVEQQRKLLTSFFVGLPVGNLLLLEGKKNDYATKAMCFANETIAPKERCEYLLDGQQRLSTLKSVFTDLFHDRAHWQDTWNRLYNRLRSRWFLRVCPQPGEDDIFGWETLNFPRTLKREPDQVLPFLEHRKILKTRTNYWYHPGYNISRHEEKDLYTHIANQAAKENVVPLYTIYEAVKYSSEGGKHKRFLHESVIKRIATRRLKTYRMNMVKVNIVKKRYLGFLNK